MIIMSVCTIYAHMYVVSMSACPPKPGSSTLPTFPTQPGQQQRRVLLLAYGSWQVYLADLRRVLLDLQLWTDVG